MNQKTMDAMDAILTRRSIRKYKKKAVGQGEREMLLRAAMRAPSTVNNRDWAFIAVDDQGLLNRLADGLNGNGEMLREAPVAFVICGDLNLALASGKDFWIVDASLAAENLLIAAHAMGLGAVYLGVFPRENKMKHVTEVLGLPEHLRPLTVIPVGWPDEEKPSREEESWEPHKIYHNCYLDSSAIQRVL